MYFLVRLMLIGSVLAAAASACAVAAKFSLVVLLIGLGVLGALSRGRRWQGTAHGTATWADEWDLRAAGMLGGDRGLILGRIESERPSFRAGFKALFNPLRRSGSAAKLFLRSLGLQKGEPYLVRLRNAVHTAVFAPTGAGKGVSIVIPSLLTCKSSMVVTDIKGELVRHTADHRRRMGGRVVTLDPFRIATRNPDSLNVLEFLHPSDPNLIDKCKAIAEAIVVRTGQEKEPHWNDSASIWIAATVLIVVLFAAPEDRSLQTVRRLLANPADLAEAVKLLCASDACGGIAARFGYQLLHCKDKELASVMTTANRHMSFLDSPAIAESTRTSTLCPADVKNRNVTVYLCLPPEHLKSQAGLLRLWLDTLTRACMKDTGGSEVVFLVDEAAAVGHMDAIDSCLNVGRGYGVRLTLIYQSAAQLKKCFPDGQDANLLANVTAVYFAVNDPDTAESVSKRLGDFTEVVTSGGTSTGGSRQRQDEGPGGSYSHSWNSNDNWSQVARRLLKPEEVCALDPRVAITFTPGVPPIWTWLLKWYEEPRLGLSPRWGARIWLAVRSFMWAALLLLCSCAIAWAVFEQKVTPDPYRGTSPRWSPR